MGDQRIIKRYSNRKLYDMTNSKYVTLQDINKLLQEGEEVLIIDNKTKQDITSVTMAQIVYEQQKSQKNKVPLTSLRDIIMARSEEFGRKIANPVIALTEEAGKTVANIRDEAERRVSSMREEAERRVGKIIKESKVKGVDAKSTVTEVTQATQHMLDEWTKQVEDNIKNAFHSAVSGAGDTVNEAMESNPIKTLHNRLTTIEHALGLAEIVSGENRTSRLVQRLELLEKRVQELESNILHKN